MLNNDVLRRIRYTFDFDDLKMIAIFGAAALKVSREQVCNWLKTDDDPDFEECNDTELSTFLNGWIIDRRGRREGEQPKPDKRLSNNVIFRKITIALNLKSEDTLAILDMANLHVSKPELSAFFRKADHKHFRKCKDQILRNFLKGIQLKYHSGSDEVAE